MKNHKQISYGRHVAQKTPMEVLHSLLPEMKISGFESARTSIFEDDCQAVINFKQVKKPRALLRPWPSKRCSQDIQLKLSVSETPEAVSTFDIYSELVQVA